MTSRNCSRALRNRRRRNGRRDDGLAERRQVDLRAVTLDDLVPDDHRVRLVWRFVEELDLTALHATIKAVEGQPGHPPRGFL